MADREREGEVLQEAKEFLASRRVGDAHVRANGQLQRPIPVLDPDGGTHSWVVPVALGGRQVGYLQVSYERLTFLRFASFPHQSRDLDSATGSESWLDPVCALERAKKLAYPGEKLYRPVLTYDQQPARLAWKVETRSAEGETRSIMVAGDTVYIQHELGDTLA